MFLELAATLGRVDHEARGTVDEAHAGLGLVAVLAAGAARDEHVDITLGVERVIVEGEAGAGERALFGWPSPEGSARRGRGVTRAGGA